MPASDDDLASNFKRLSDDINHPFEHFFFLAGSKSISAETAYVILQAMIKEGSARELIHILHKGPSTPHNESDPLWQIALLIHYQKPNDLIWESIHKIIKDSATKPGLINELILILTNTEEREEE